MEVLLWGGAQIAKMFEAYATTRFRLLGAYIINSSTLSFSCNVVQEATRVEVLLMFRPRSPTYTFSCLSIPKASLGCSKKDILYLYGIYTSIHLEYAVYSVSSPSSPSLV